MSTAPRYYLVSVTIGWNDEDAPAPALQTFRVAAADEEQAIDCAETELDRALGGGFVDEPAVTLDDNQAPQSLRVIWL